MAPQGTQDSGPGPQAEDGPLTAEPVEVTRIVVPLDGSPFAEKALPVARWAAGETGAGLHLVQVVQSDESAEAAIRYLDSVARRHQTKSWDVLRDEDVSRALVEAVTSRPASIGCMATHGRDRSAALVGSVAASLLSRTDDAVLLVGPRAAPPAATGAAVVVAVDGTHRDEALVRVGLGWAARLDRRVIIATVAEPAPQPYRPGVTGQRAHGPDEPEKYLASLAARASTSVEVDTDVIYDPISVRDGLVPMLERRAALVVLGSRHRQGVPRMVLGSHAARVVHDATVPALTVPLPEAG